MKIDDSDGVDLLTENCNAHTELVWVVRTDEKCKHLSDRPTWFHLWKVLEWISHLVK
jgi:hypothetical protein